MAVYKRNYKRFQGSLTPEYSRFLILPRYSFQNVFESKFIVGLFFACLVPHLGALTIIYLKANAGALTALNLPFLQFLAIDGTFFQGLFQIQTYLSFFLVTFVGPGLVGPDLVNNALPLYLSRPFTRQEYVIGKLTVLVTLTSLVTWIPGLLLILIQTDQAGFSWVWDNWKIPAGVIFGSLMWILTISFIALAISAWVKVRPTAILSLFGIFFIAGNFGRLANVILGLRTPWGLLIDLNVTMRTLWGWLFVGQDNYADVFRTPRFAHFDLPAWTGLLSLAAFCAFSVFLLMKKVRACEVVR